MNKRQYDQFLMECKTELGYTAPEDKEAIFSYMEENLKSVKKQIMLPFIIIWPFVLAPASFALAFTIAFKGNLDSEAVTTYGGIAILAAITYGLIKLRANYIEKKRALFTKFWNDAKY